MATTKEIQNKLIDKILTIRDTELLLALNHFISSNPNSKELEKLTSAQIEMLEMSKKDIESGDMITQEAMDKRNLKWLNEL